MTHPTPTRLIDPLASAPRLDGRRAVVAGGSSGLELVTTRVLAQRGAEVMIGTRDTARAEHARALGRPFAASATDATLASALWTRSERLTDVRFLH